ncbi:unnamed protein product [Ectocarpus sp. 6 AP-2014]
MVKERVRYVGCMRRKIPHPLGRFLSSIILPRTTKHECNQNHMMRFREALDETVRTPPFLETVSTTLPQSTSAHRDLRNRSSAGRGAASSQTDTGYHKCHTPPGPIVKARHTLTRRG